MTRTQSSNTIESRAFVLGRIPHGDADLIVQLFTESGGRVAAYARGARRSNKRFNGALEPMHTLHVELVERASGDLLNLRAATLHRPRQNLATHLEQLTAAGQALRWVRAAAPINAREPDLWAALEHLMDELDLKEPIQPVQAALGAFGLRHLEVLGWGINLESCVRCDRTCPPTRPAWVSPERGGLICRSCGGGPFQLGAKIRQELLTASRSNGAPLTQSSSTLALKIVDRAMKAHLGQSGESGRNPRGLGK